MKRRRRVVRLGPPRLDLTPAPTSSGCWCKAGRLRNTIVGGRAVRFHRRDIQDVIRKRRGIDVVKDIG